jgi:hypothetical protein
MRKRDPYIFLIRLKMYLHGKRDAITVLDGGRQMTAGI